MSFKTIFLKVPSKKLDLSRYWVTQSDLSFQAMLVTGNWKLLTCKPFSKHSTFLVIL